MRMPLVCATLVLASVALAQVPPALRGALGAVTNGDFAQLSDDGKGFAGWQFIISRNATVSVAVDATGGRGGRWKGRGQDWENSSPKDAGERGRIDQGKHDRNRTTRLIQVNRGSVFRGCFRQPCGPKHGSFRLAVYLLGRRYE